MFYSHDLLGRKTPLGAIWTVAHGKKLSKGKILGINVVDICQQILQPDVPHSLRLQGILVGGLVILFKKQQSYLLEDLQELVKRVKTATAPPPADAAGVRGKAVLSKAKDRARLDAITMLNMDDVMAANMDMSQMMQAGDYSDMPLADGLFVMPSLADDPMIASGTTVGLGDTTEQAQRLLSQMQQQHHGLAGLGGNAFAQDEDVAWELQNETFDVAPDFNLFEDEPEPLMPAQDPQQQQPAPSAPSADANQGQQMLLGPQDDQEEMLVFDEQEQMELDAVELPGQQQGQERQQGRQGSVTGSESTALEAAHVQGQAGSVEGAGAGDGKGTKPTKKRGGTKRKAGAQVLIDDLQHLQITSRQYRKWVQDQSELIAPRPLKQQAQQGGRAGMLLVDVTALLNGAPAAGGVGWCAELREMFRGFVMGNADKNAPNARRRGRQQQQQEEQAPLAGSGELLMDDDQMPMDDMEPLVMMEDDQLMGLPFGGDIETERLRHGTTTPGADTAALRRNELGFSPGSSAEAAAQLLGGVTTGRRSRMTNASSDSLATESERSMGVDGRGRRGRGSGLGGSGGLGAFMQEDDQEPLYFGNGSLEDLLPAVDEDAGAMDLMGGPFAAGGPNSGGAHGAHGSDGSGAWLNRFGGHSYEVPTSQFPLLEESAPDATQPAPPDASVNRQTLLVINAFRARLAQAKARAGPEAASDVSISFFEMVQKLSRGEAAKLFYQVCVTTSTGYFHADQEHAYGDIRIREGRAM